MSSIDWDKPVKTRANKCEVRIYTTEGEDPDQPVVAEYQDSHGRWWLIKRALHGRVSTLVDSPSDLVNVPQQHTVTINVYRYDGDIQVRSHPNRADADQRTTESRIACIEVTFTDGEGL